RRDGVLAVAAAEPDAPDDAEGESAACPFRRVARRRGGRTRGLTDNKMEHTMRNKLMTAAAIALATALASPLFATRTEAQQAKAPEPPPTPVEVARADIARIAPRHWSPGSVVSRDDAKLATSAAGRLEYVAEVGTRLKAGERIAKLEDQAILLRIEDTKTEVARIKAQRELADRTRS